MIKVYILASEVPFENCHETIGVYSTYEKTLEALLKFAQVNNITLEYQNDEWFSIKDGRYYTISGWEIE